MQRHATYHCREGPGAAPFTFSTSDGHALVGIVGAYHERHMPNGERRHGRTRRLRL